MRSENSLILWHMRCKEYFPAGFGSESQTLPRRKPFFLPSDPPAQRARDMADCESRPNPVPTLLL